MSAYHTSRLARLPLPSYSECNETAPIPSYKVSFPTLNLFAPGFALSELGVTADWSAAYTPNSGPMDAVVKVQLAPERKQSAQEYVHELRAGLTKDRKLSDLEFSFDAGGMIRGAMNEGKSTPINIRIKQGVLKVDAGRMCLDLPKSDKATFAKQRAIQTYQKS